MYIYCIPTALQTERSERDSERESIRNTSTTIEKAIKDHDNIPPIHPYPAYAKYSVLRMYTLLNT